MSFLNLTPGEFFVLLGGLGGLITALYLLGQTKRRKVVSTLRFWTSAGAAEERQTRKRMQEPWSLIIQLASLLLLLLAIAQLQWGTRERRNRDHVLLLDTSAWSAALQRVGQSNSPLIDREKKLAATYIAGLPGRDRVMIVLADALATPVTPFTADRRQLSQALHDAKPGFSALNIDQALSYAQQALTWSGGQPGEIVYAGPKRVDTEEPVVREVPNLRVLAVPCDCEDIGIVRTGVKRNEDAPGEWQATITVRNNGLRLHTVRLNTSFGATLFAPRMLRVAPQRETAVEYIFVTDSPGQFVAELDSPDALSSDNTVALALPRTGTVRVAVYTTRPETLRPLLEADQRLSATFYTPAQYQPNPPADITLLDQFSPTHLPEIASLWIQPSRDASPLPVKTTVENAVITNWNATTPLASGLHAKETRLPSAEVFHTFDDDIAVGDVNEGPVVVARPASSHRPKLAAVGFDPLAGGMKFQVTTPLLFANLFHWLSPEHFETLEIYASHVGAANVTLDPNEQAVRVSTMSGEAIPFTVHDQTLQLFASNPGMVRITSDGRERIVSLTLPDVAEHEWTPPAASASGLPPARNWVHDSASLWQSLALLAGIGLFAEWMLFGWRRLVRPESRAVPQNRSARVTPDTDVRQLVSR